MQPIIFLFLGLAVGIALYFLKKSLREKKRREIMARPFPQEWKDYLTRHVYIYRHLPERLLDQLHADVQVFLEEKNFEGAGGFEITDEVRVVVAAEACILLLNRNPSFFPNLKSIVIYPGAFHSRQPQALGNTMVESDVSRAGESWNAGTLVLAWDYVERGMKNPTDGHNVVLHEFAHQLDGEDGATDGAPILERRSQYAKWAEIMGREFEQLRDDADHHRKNVMDDYGATNPAEFFAVATETFFGKPRQLKKKEPELYEQFKEFYHLDPALWEKEKKAARKKSASGQG